MNNYNYALSILTLVASFVLLGAVWLYTVLPTSVWFEYQEIVPLKEDFLVGESVSFVSIADFHRKSHVEWVDVLMCDLQNDEIGAFFYSSYVSNAVVEPRKAGESGKPWKYQSPIPEEEAVCYLDSTTVLQLPFGIKQQAKVTSSKFTVSNP